MSCEKYLFLVAHQDDELLTFGGLIAQYIEAGHEVYVACFSKGEASSIRGTLGDGCSCEWHDGSHSHKLSVADFIAARDGELFESCLALGLPSRNILLPRERFLDGSLTPWQCAELIEWYLDRYPGASVVTHSPIGSSLQHADHQALGVAALWLYSQGAIANLSFCVDPYYAGAFETENPEVDLVKIDLGSSAREKVSLAIQSYKTWSPEQGKYAVGYHSVREFHDSLSSDYAFYRHEPDPSGLMDALSQWSEKREAKLKNAASAELSSVRAEVDRHKAESERLKNKLASLKKSASFRAGRIVTAPVRMFLRKG